MYRVPWVQAIEVGSLLERTINNIVYAKHYVNRQQLGIHEDILRTQYEIGASDLDVYHPDAPLNV